MAIRVGINGFGRIGRNVLRAARKSGAAIDFVGINDLTDTATLAHLFKYDSVHGTYQGEVSSKEGASIVVGDEIRITVIAAGFDRLDDLAPLRSTSNDDSPRTSSTRITELFGTDDQSDPLADDGDDDDFDVPSFLK